MAYLYEKMYGGGQEGKRGKKSNGDRKVDVKGMEMAVQEVSSMIEMKKKTQLKN